MKPKLLIVFICILATLLNLSAENITKFSGDEKKSNYVTWILTVSPDGMEDLSANLTITKTCKTNKYSGTFEMLGNKTNISEIKINPQTGTLSFKAEMRFAVLSFDLLIKNNKIDGKVNSSDGVTGNITGYKVKKSKKEKSTTNIPKGITGKWEGKLDIAGMDKMQVKIIIKTSEKNPAGYKGKLGIMGEYIVMTNLNYNKTDNTCSFSVNMEEETIYDFMLNLTGTKMKGKISSAGNIVGKIIGNYIGEITPPEPYKYTPLSAGIKDLYLETGNLKSKKILMVVQGGPLEKVQIWPNFDTWKNDLHIVFVKQAQDMNPTLWEAPDLTLEEAYSENQISVEMIDRTIKHFKNKGKQIMLWGGSYGVFLIEEYLARKGFTPDAVCISAGRLDIEEKMWQATANLKMMMYKYNDDGSFVIEKAKIGEDAHKAMCMLQASLGCHRYSKEFKDMDLSRLIFQYGMKDEIIGTLSKDEIKFLESKGAKVIGYPDTGHGDTMNDENLKTAVEEMLKVISEK